MVFRVSSLALWLFLLPLLTLHQPALGADATSFDPTQVAVKAKGAGGVPVGTIISWPVATDPEDMDNWLECNGQSISQSVYPELFALVGTNVPDLRGLFLRGHGGNSAALGQTQGDAIRNITGSLGRLPSAIGGDATGPFYTSRNANDGGLYPSNTARYVDMDISRVVPTASENRPVNRAVRYLIRVRQ